MATTIIEGQQYALTNQFSNNKGQSMIFVKLTDSALKTIEDYAAAFSKGNNSSSLKPSIEFRPNNSQGVITIPTKVNNVESEKHSYNFSVKDVQNDGILECIQQNHNMSMEALGKIMFRMQIHANDDSYQNTKVKMAVAAEQELKKYNTKVIQSSDPNVGRKVKVKRPVNTKPYVSLNSNSSNNTPNSSASSMYKQQPSSMPLSSMPRFNKFSNTSSGGLTKTPNFFHNGPPLNGGDTLKKTIRDYLVHFLAVKSSKLSDLQAKMQEKLKESVDKNTVIGVLNTISTLRDGTHHLNESAWDEVQIDWLHYSKEDRDSVQKRNPLMANLNETHNASNLKPTSMNIANSTGNGTLSGNSISPLSDSSARSLLSPNSVGTSPSQKNSPYSKANLKRNESSYPSNNLKKFKSDNSRLAVHSNSKTYSSANNNNAIVSHLSPLDKLNNNGSDHDSPESRNSFPSNSNCYKQSIPLILESSNLINKKSDASTDKEAYNSRANPYHRISNGGNRSGSTNSSPNSSPDSGISHIGNVPSSDSSINDPDEYMSKYTKIQNNDQCAQYVNDFHAEFPEYRRLFDYVEGVSRQFEELREMILSKEEESEEWHELIKLTTEKYDEVKHKSPRYNKAQKRLRYLHYKLQFLKNKISEFQNR